jgi:hypothetical protein
MSNDRLFSKALPPSPSMFPNCPGRVGPACTRREVLTSAGLGFGWLAFSGLATANGVKPISGLHLPARAKHVIFLFMDGGVSHVDTFDYKPELIRRAGQPAEWRADEKSQAAGQNRKWLPPLWTFRQRGESGLWASDLLPHMAGIIDECCVIRSLVGETPLHGAQNLLLHTGRSLGAAPSMGSWISHGLGTENENLPGYVLLNNDWIPNGGWQNFASGFLPATSEATLIRAEGNPVDNIVPADHPAVQQAKLEFLRRSAATDATTAAVESTIATFETAARMQTSVPDVCDVSDETGETRRLYGLDRADNYQRFYALQCLRARRLVEAGVRFVEVTCPLTHANNAPWDQHGGMRKYHAENALITDQPVAALITDLKRRGLLDETLVLWAGEMGRTPHSAGSDGRDHHVSGYTVCLAGGGVAGGMTFGETDEMGMGVVENPIDIHDIHATILHCLGIDHKQLTFRFGGRDVRLTDVEGHVLHDILS